MTERLRILHLIKGLGPGGAERLLLSAAHVRDREAFEYDVVYLLPWKTALVSAIEAEGVTTRCLGVRHEQDLRWLVRLRRLLKERHYDVVHVHSPYVAGMARLVIRSLPAPIRPRVVSSEHNVWSSHSRLTRVLNGATFTMGDAWLGVSGEVRASIPPRLRDRVEVVVHGIVLDEVETLALERDAVRAELGVRAGEVVVATIANFRAQKAYPDLLAAARLVADRAVPARFVIIGQGPLEAEVRALHAALDLSDSVDLLGYRSDAIRVLAGADLFALSSLYEGYPVAVMEALAMGLPIVATAVGGIPEAVRDGREGLLVPPRRPDLLAGAIESLVRDPQRRAAMSTAAAARGRDYDIARAVRRTEELYRELSALPASDGGIRRR